jgi:hypothetical protein
MRQRCSTKFDLCQSADCSRPWAAVRIRLRGPSLFFCAPHWNAAYRADRSDQPDADQTRPNPEDRAA